MAISFIVSAKCLVELNSHASYDLYFSCLFLFIWFVCVLDNHVCGQGMGCFSGQKAFRGSALHIITYILSNLENLLIPLADPIKTLHPFLILRLLQLIVWENGKLLHRWLHWLCFWLLEMKGLFSSSFLCNFNTYIIYWSEVLERPTSQKKFRTCRILLCWLILTVLIKLLKLLLIEFVKSC